MEIVIVLALVAFAIRLFMRRGRRGSRPELDAVGWVAGTNWRVVVPLARVETRRLLRHPALLSGIALTPFILLLATATENNSANNPSGPDTWLDMSTGVALGLVPFAWLVIVATQLLTTRPARTGADALFSALPAPQPVRTAGLLTTAVSSFGVAAVIAIGWVVLLQSGSRTLTGSPVWPEIGVGLLIAAGAVTVGVSVGRFLPHPVFGVLGAFACAFIQVRFFETDSWPWNLTLGSPYRFLGFIAETNSADAALQLRPAGWHLLYLLALVVVMGCVALARNGVPRSLAAALAGAVAVTAVAGWAQTRPPGDARVAAMLRFLYEPETRHECEQTGATRYCAFGPDAPARTSQWRPPVESVLALVPAAVAARQLEVLDRPVTVVGNSDCSPRPYTHSLAPEVAQRLDPDRAWPADGAVHPGGGNNCGSEFGNGLFLRLATAAWAVGLPPAPHGRDIRCVADRQARSVVALWLAARATPDGARQLRTLLAEDSTMTHLRFAWTDPPMLGVRFARADATMAVAMLRRPKADVVRILDQHWATLIDPATPASTLGALAGVGAGRSPIPADGSPPCA